LLLDAGADLFLMSLHVLRCTPTAGMARGAPRIVA
jgi:hypothetical protein